VRLENWSNVLGKILLLEVHDDEHAAVPSKGNGLLEGRDGLARELRRELRPGVAGLDIGQRPVCDLGERKSKYIESLKAMKRTFPVQLVVLSNVASWQSTITPSLVNH